MEHPQTVLLQKVLKSNISLRDAHLKKEDPSKVQKCWVDLQQSVNMLYDNKTASGEFSFGINFVYLYGVVSCGAGSIWVGL